MDPFTTSPSISRSPTIVTDHPPPRSLSPTFKESLKILESDTIILSGPIVDGFPDLPPTTSSQRTLYGAPYKLHDSSSKLSTGVRSQDFFFKTQHHSQKTLRSSSDELGRSYSERAMSDSFEKSGGVQQVEDRDHVYGAKGAAVTGPALTKKQKVLRHLKRWWWAHLLVLIALVALVVCLIIFVGVPRIAQSRVNSAQLTLQGISLSQTQADNYTLAINATLRADDSIRAVIDAFDGVMYLEDVPPQTPFARLAFPSVTSASETPVNLTQFTPITDLAAFTTFNSYFIVNETIRVSVEGTTQLRVAGINRKYPVFFKKTIEMPALGNLNGTTVADSSVLLQPDANGNNFLGTAVIPNRSYITFTLGNTTFINYMQNANGTFQNVGSVFIDNLTLSPGENSVPLRGTVAQPPVLEQIQQRPYCETGNIPFLLQGSDVTNNGQRLQYFTDSLASTNQSVSIPILSDLQALGLTIECAS